MIRLLLVIIIILVPSLSFADCTQYKNDVQSVLYHEGVSADYYYLMAAESNCRPGSVSSAGAVGFWQMLPATMHSFGCYDADDIKCQTLAAARYIKHLEKRFIGDDVIISWNMGGTNYKRAGKPTKQALGLLHKYKKLLKDGKHENNDI